MALGSTSYLRFAIRLLLIAAVAVVLRLPLRAQDNPMDLPPRTAPPPPSVQQKETEEAPANGQSASPSITPESPTGEDNSRFVFKKQVQEVFLHATVVDEMGRPVTTLTRNDFQIFQNGQAGSNHLVRTGRRAGCNRDCHRQLRFYAGQAHPSRTKP